MSDKVIKAPFVSMSDIRKEIKTIDPKDPKILSSPEEVGEEDDTNAQEQQEETAIDDEVIDGSVSILLENAKEEADLILKEAREMAEQIKEQARQQGFDMGYSEGVASAQEEYTHKHKQLEEKALEMDAAYDEMIREAEPLMAEVISDLVDNMVGHYAVNKEVIMFLIELALGELTTYGDFMIRVSPGDYDYVMSRKEELDHEVGDKVKLEVIKDGNLGPMDCLIETAYGNVDASLGLRRENLRKELKLIADSLRYRED